jgi:hypothetical protein
VVFTPDGVTPSDVRDYRTYLTAGKRAAPATVNHRLAALRAFFRFAKASARSKEDPTRSPPTWSSTAAASAGCQSSASATIQRGASQAPQRPAGEVGDQLGG